MTIKNGCHCRMFAKREEGRKLLTDCEHNLFKLIMQDGPSQEKESALVGQNAQPVSVGYTYLLQFLSHDIVPPTRDLNKHPRTVSPNLNLDSLYGQGQSGFDAQYFDSEGYFRRNHCNPSDVIRRPANIAGRCIADIPEPRNDENIVVMQMHRLWQEVHNQNIDKLRHIAEINARINHARFNTIAIFHTVLIEDVLAKILHPDVYHYFFSDFNPFYYRHDEKMRTIPLEFSHAAFRFGHSMVRARYRINSDNRSEELATLITRSQHKPLAPELNIEWKFFFQRPGIEINEANPIDLLIAAAMTRIHPRVDIIEHNLAAGETSKIPSGEAIINEILSCNKFRMFRDKFMTQLQNRWLKTDVVLHPYPKINCKIRQINSESRTPLWLYVLHENLCDYDTVHNRKLGLLGSAIVADVLRQSIHESYLPNSVNASYICTDRKRLAHYNLAKKTLGSELSSMSAIINLISLSKQEDN